MEESCASCGRPAATPFCPHCGQQRARDLRLTLGAFVRDGVAAATDLDGTLWRTGRVLITDPGALTLAHVRGDRVRWIAPLRLFLIVNVGYFVLAGAMGHRTFDTPLRVHVRNTAHKAVAAPMVEARLRERGTTLGAYAARFDAASTTQAKSLVVTMVPMFALLVALVQWRRRVPAVQHVVFAFHAMAVMLVAVTMVPVVWAPIAHAVAGWLGAQPDASQRDLMVSLPLLASFALWLAIGLRRAYGERPLAATGKALLLAGGFGVVLFAYRAVLFFVTFWTV